MEKENTVITVFLSIHRHRIESWNWNLFFEIFMISFVKSGPVKVEVPVEWIETDSRLGKSISRSTVDMWTNPIGIRSIGKRFQKIYDYCGHHWFCNNLRPILSQLCKIPDFWLNERIAAIFVNLRCRVDAGWSPNAKNYDSAWSEVNAWFCSMPRTILSQNSEISR